MKKISVPSFFVPVEAMYDEIVGLCWWCGVGCTEEEGCVFAPLADGREAALCHVCVHEAFADDRADEFAWLPFDPPDYADYGKAEGACFSCSREAAAHEVASLPFVLFHASFGARIEDEGLFCSPRCVREFFIPYDRSFVMYMAKRWRNHAHIEASHANDGLTPRLRSRDRRLKPRA